jgi:5-methylcytosine-specific restriction endonuclease McrA
MRGGDSDEVFVFFYLSVRLYFAILIQPPKGFKIKDSAMLRFIKGLPAKDADLHLKKANHAMEMARQNAILWFGEILGRKLYRDLGYSSMPLYAQQELGWSQSKAYDFMKICEKLDELPAVKKKVEEGKLGYGRTRTIVAVASPETEKEWVDLALTQSHTKLKEKVKKARRRAAEVASRQVAFLPEEPVPAAAVPQRVTLEMTPTQLARYEALWEKLRKQGGLPADKVEALLVLMQSGVSNQLENSAAPPVQIHVHQCPDCEKATVQTARGELVLSSEETERIACDTQISEPGHRNTTTIPPKTRRLVLARDRHRCQTPGCPHTHFLEIHHMIPRARGGTNTPDNLTTLCSACHALVHQRKGRVREIEPIYGDGESDHALHAGEFLPDLGGQVQGGILVQGRGLRDQFAQEGHDGLGVDVPGFAFQMAGFGGRKIEVVVLERPDDQVETIARAGHELVQDVGGHAHIPFGVVDQWSHGEARVPLFLARVKNPEHGLADELGGDGLGHIIIHPGRQTSCPVFA